MSANKALVQRLYDEVAGQGNIDLIDELVDENMIEHEEFPGVEPNREGVKAVFRLFRSAFPDLRFEALQSVEEGDLVCVMARITGTHREEFMGMPATGKPIDVTAFDLLRIRDGRIVEHWGLTDSMTMMVQLGAIPGPA